MPKWAVRATEASMEEKAKGKKAPAKKDAPAKGKDGKVRVRDRLCVRLISSSCV